MDNSKLKTKLFFSFESSSLCDAFFLNVSLDNAASEGVLASFFNSLLSKKTGSPGSPGAGGVQSTAKKSGTEEPLETYDPSGWGVLEVGEAGRSVCFYLTCRLLVFWTAKQGGTSLLYTEEYTLYVIMQVSWAHLRWDFCTFRLSRTDCWVSWDRS